MKDLDKMQAIIERVADLIDEVGLDNKNKELLLSIGIIYLKAQQDQIKADQEAK